MFVCICVCVCVCMSQQSKLKQLVCLHPRVASTLASQLAYIKTYSMHKDIHTYKHATIQNIQVCRYVCIYNLQDLVNTIFITVASRSSFSSGLNTREQTEH